MKSKLTFSLHILLLLNFAVFAQPNYDEAEIKTIPVNDHIHMLQWSGAGNMMVLTGKDGNILIDDQFAPLSDKINNAIQAVQTGPVKFLFNTHYHGDHSGGNEKFAQMGATIFAHENVRARLSADSSIIKFTQAPKPSPEASWPVITFSEGLNVYLNNEYIMIFHVHHAHTDGDAILYLPQSNVIHTGDCFMKGRFPFIDLNSGGSVNGWIAAASKILTVIDDETVVIPGHGDLATKKDYENVRDAVMSLRDAVKTNYRLGKSLEDILAMNLTKNYENNFGSGFIKGDALVTTIYKELSTN